MSRLIKPIFRNGHLTKPHKTTLLRTGSVSILSHTTLLNSPNPSFSLTKHFTTSTATATATDSSSSVSYVSDMRRSAFKENILRLLRNEVQYELDHSPLSQPPSQINGFKVDERPGEQWISLEKKFAKNQEIKLEVTMFDGSEPIPTEGEKKGQIGQEQQLHISLIVSVFKQDSDLVLEFVCSAWPDTVEIERIYTRGRAKMPHAPYTGPAFRELDDELQNSLYEFLEERGIDESLCVFLHKYMVYKDRAEYLRWMGSVKSVVEKGE